MILDSKHTRWYYFITQNWNKPTEHLPKNKGIHET